MDADRGRFGVESNAGIERQEQHTKIVLRHR
jgi:hypothetical protein